VVLGRGWQQHNLGRAVANRFRVGRDVQPGRDSGWIGVRGRGNMWHGVDGDNGSGVTGTVSGMASTAQVTIASNTAKCVWVCCPFASGSGCTGIANQCP
jgi:hypothetical protein